MRLFLTFSFVFALVSKELIYLNTEFLFIFSFLVFFTICYQSLAKATTTALDSRATDLLARSRATLTLTLDGLTRQQRVYQKGLASYDAFLDLLLFATEQANKLVAGREEKLPAFFSQQTLNNLRQVLNSELLIKIAAQNIIKSKLEQLIQQEEKTRKKEIVLSRQSLLGDKPIIGAILGSYTLFAYISLKLRIRT